MKYTILIKTDQNGLKLDKKMVGKKSDYMVKSMNHVIAPKSTIEKIDVGAELEDGHGVYYYRMDGSLLSYLTAKRDFGSLVVYNSLS